VEPPQPAKAKPTPCAFSRDDLKEEVKLKIEQEDFYHSNISVENYKGSEKVISSEAPITENVMPHKSNWKRPDLVEKRVLRALCDIAKDFFNDITKAAKANTNDKKLNLWDQLIQRCFPTLHKTAQLKILGQICVSCMGWKFTEKVNSLKNFNTSQKRQLIKFGKVFRTQRNSSKVKERKILLNHPIIRIGKLLYESSRMYQAGFWKHINDHKKTEIDDDMSFKDLHSKVVARVNHLECHRDLFSFNSS